MTKLLEVVFAFIGTVGFGVLFGVAKKHLIHCGITGGLGWLIYLIAFYFSHSPYTATLISAFAITRISRYLSVRRKTPATVFLLTGIFTLVPGAGVYYTAFYLFLNQTELGYENLMSTLKIALAISIGIVLGYAVKEDIAGIIKRKINKNKEIAKIQPEK